MRLHPCIRSSQRRSGADDGAVPELDSATPPEGGLPALSDQRVDEPDRSRPSISALLLLIGILAGASMVPWNLDADLLNAISGVVVAATSLMHLLCSTPRGNDE